MFGARADNRTAFCAAKTWFAVAAAADCKVGSTRNFPSNARGVRKIRERTVPTLAADVSFCTGRERIIEPLFHRNHKLIFTRQHPDESKTYVKNRVLLLKNI